MDNLFILRHGSYNTRTGHLYNIGRNNFYIVSNLIKSILKNNSEHIILAPSLDRTLESAEILKEVTSNAKIIKMEDLISPEEWEESTDLNKLYMKIQQESNGVNNVSVIMSGCNNELLPRHLFRNVLGYEKLKFKGDENRVYLGETSCGVHIDFKSITVEYLIGRNPNEIS